MYPCSLNYLCTHIYSCLFPANISMGTRCTRVFLCVCVCVNILADCNLSFAISLSRSTYSWRWLKLDSVHSTPVQGSRALRTATATTTTISEHNGGFVAPATALSTRKFCLPPSRTPAVSVCLSLSLCPPTTANCKFLPRKQDKLYDSHKFHLNAKSDASIFMPSFCSLFFQYFLPSSLSLTRSQTALSLSAAAAVAAVLLFILRHMQNSVEVDGLLAYVCVSVLKWVCMPLCVCVYLLVFAYNNFTFNNFWLFWWASSSSGRGRGSYTWTGKA